VMFLVVRLQIAHIPSLIPYTTLFRSLEGTGDGARINASTVSGDIRLGKARGELEVASVSGNVYISDSAFTRIEAANTSGDIDMAGTFASGGTFRFKAISGDITLRFAEKPAGSFD